MKAWFGN